jgi:hypothetical protein
VRASEQSGVAFLGGGRVRWRVGLLVLALQITAILPLLVLSASAYGEDLAADATAPDGVSAPEAAPADGAGAATPQADPVAKSGAQAAETPVPPVPPAAGETTASTSTDPPPAPASVAPDLIDLALPPASVMDAADRANAPAQDAGARVDAAESPEPPAAAIGEAVQTAAEATPPAPIVSTPVGQPEPRPREPAHEPGRSAAATGAAAAALARPSPLVPAVTPQASLVVSAWRAPSGSVTTASHASKPSAGAPGARPVRAPLDGPSPNVPRTPSSSVCAGSSSCGTAFSAILPLSAALGCLCALLFERLVAALAAWRPRRFVSLRERPG